MIIDEIKPMYSSPLFCNDETFVQAEGDGCSCLG